MRAMYASPGAPKSFPRLSFKGLWGVLCCKIQVLSLHSRVIERLTTELRIENYIHFVGRKNNVLPFLSIFDVGMLALQESMAPCTVVQFMKCSTSKVPEIPNINTPFMTATG